MRCSSVTAARATSRWGRRSRTATAPRPRGSSACSSTRWSCASTPTAIPPSPGWPSACGAPGGWELRLSELPLLGAAERHQLQREWSEGAWRSAAPELLHEPCFAHAARRPDAVAVAEGGGSDGGAPLAVSYGELAARAR